ncbi:PQQ-dependent sugar dehydrogenase [Aliiglaciecola lipolytica]|uniref:Soluble aldose sugar dehydrogenase yliI n=1 Tax=Aliiglaciecola lipolytica E3 TaxID=1127673 RepID=K6YP79_9ALTE|nr:PQQ-dependent sugar dehydrogenase [Aliiglaciecola lipolytica]GAC13145.1 soluble aldose sugar dehydrogenase yliI [Aliiglaciecola lipolytica E3]
MALKTFPKIILCLLLVSNWANGKDKESSLQYDVKEVVTGLNFPWSLAFISDNQFLVTERTGKLRHVVNFTLSKPITGLPEDIYVNGQGGLQDVVLHPNYAQNGWIYLSYSAGTDERNTLKVMRAKLENNHLVDSEVIFTVEPYRSTPVHYGARLAFMDDNSLLISSGDGFDYREDAQRKNNQMGKILRVLDTGETPTDNPYIGETEKNLSAAVYSIGHRNPQGLVYDLNRDLVFSNEHGPAGGDEINIIKRGDNYGWPIVTNGKDYSGAIITPFKKYQGMRQPLVDWTPSIAPSSLAMYNGVMFPQMRGDLLVSTLKSKEILWIQMQGNKVVDQQSFLSELGYRFRDIKVHPDGSLYVLVDNEQGKILRVTSKSG